MVVALLLLFALPLLFTLTLLFVLKAPVGSLELPKLHVHSHTSFGPLLYFKDYKRRHLLWKNRQDLTTEVPKEEPKVEVDNSLTVTFEEVSSQGKRSSTEMTSSKKRVRSS